MHCARQDDSLIPNDEELYRRIVADWVVSHPFRGTVLSSAAFSNERLSVDRSSRVASPKETFDRGAPDTRGVVSIMAGQARECGQAVVADPIEGNPAHSLIVGHKTKSIKRRLRDFSIWVYPLRSNAL